MVTLFKKSKFFWNICIYAQILLEFRVVLWGFTGATPFLHVPLVAPQKACHFLN